MTSQSTHRYFTTPIYYASGDLHAGHFYTTTIANVLGAHYRHRGLNVKVLTGMDEHGEKIEETAKKNNQTPQAFVDDLATKWKKQFADMELTYDIFMRTSSAEHAQNVQSILQKCYDNGDIYYGEHSGHYCIGCEAFLTASQMDESQNCLDHKRPTELRVEKNYFFRTTKYRDRVIELLKSGKLTTSQRYINELVAIAQGMEGDLSISRPKSRTTWGIELPFDKEHVTYVWFDALPNYITGIGGITEALKSPYWNNCVHILGKEITRFHAIFWPAMLMSLDLPLPRLMIHGWLLSDSFKMSKSLGNAARLESFGYDAYANAVLRMINPSDDFEITVKTVVERFNADLANGIGNLLARTLGMIEKYFTSTLPAFSPKHGEESEMAIRTLAASLPTKVCAAMDDVRTADALNSIWSLIAITDKYISDQKPWALAKDESEDGKAKLGNVLAHAVGSLRVVGLLAAAFFPAKMKLLLESLGEDTSHMENAVERSQHFEAIPVGHRFTEIPKLYMRLELPTETTTPPTPKESKKNSAPTGEKAPLASATPKSSEPTKPEGIITIDDFAKVDMRVATVLLVEHVPGSDKLLHLTVSVGDLGTKEIFAGIRQWVKPEDLANRKVVVVANLQPRKMKFGTSEAMLLATDTLEGSVAPLLLADNLKEGARLG
jgi:methionyl-tRNA synthetase